MVRSFPAHPSELVDTLIPNSEQAWKRAMDRARVRRSAKKENGPIPEERIEEIRKEVAHLSRREAKIFLKRRIKDLTRQVKNSENAIIPKLARIYVMEEAYEQIESWLSSPFHFEKPAGSFFHILREDAIHDRLLELANIKNEIATEGPIWDAEVFKNAEVFIIEHDWASAFANADDFESGQFRLPFDLCAFEARISGRHVITVAVQDDEDILIQVIVGADSGWILGEHFRFSDLPSIKYWHGNTEVARLGCLLAAQIKAISISLEAEVTTVEIIRAPYQLNKAREKRGVLPLYDYHTVSLHSRLGRANKFTEADSETGRHVRLHFVRGHWRHFEKFKTWIKWHLRGDPDLGFIDKHYRL